MSALPLEADILGVGMNVYFVPLADMRGERVDIKLSCSAAKRTG
jgi:hypothetical protein